MKRTVLSLVFLIIFASLAFAIPVEINYQGYLTDSNGLPVDDTPDVQFKLYNHETLSEPANLKWDSGFVSVSVEKGVYSIILGEAPQPAIDPAIFADQLWLGIEVESTGEMTPRQKLTSVGFSVRALSADTVADGAVTDATITGPISSTKIEQGPGSALNADTVDYKHAADLQDRVTGACGAGSSISTVNADGSVVCVPTGLTGTLTNNFIPRSDGTGLVDSTIFDNGSIGIGIINPAARLDVSPGVADYYSNWHAYGVTNPCLHCADTCDGDMVAEYTCPAGVSSTCEDLRDYDGEYWQYRSIECDQPQQAALLRGDVTADGTITATGLAVNDVSATGTITAVNLAGDGTNVTNVNAELLDGQHSSDIIAAASDEVRTSISSCDVTISTPGSYYVTQNLSTTGTCITIASNDVTLDLMGFVLTGDGELNDYGIFINNVSNIEIRNGTVRNFDDGIYLYSGSPTVALHKVFGVRAFDNSENGIAVYGYQGDAIIRNCIASNNGVGIFAYRAIVSNNIANGNSSHGIMCEGGCTVSNNVAMNNGSKGISASTGLIGGGTIINNTANSNFDGIYVGSGYTIIGNTTNNNNSYGILAGNASIIDRNTASDNGGTGLQAALGSTISNNVSYSNGSSGFRTATGSVVINNTSFNNGGDGIETGDGSTVRNNTAYQNQYHGISTHSYSLLDNNTAYSNDQIGGGYENISPCATCVSGLNLAP